MDGQHKAGRAATPQTPFLTTKEVAELIGLHHVSVRRMVANGTIPSIKLGTKRLINRRWYEDFVRRSYDGKLTSDEAEAVEEVSSS